MDFDEITYEALPEKYEIEANLDYLNEKNIALSDLFLKLDQFRKHLEKFGVNPVRFHALYDHICEQIIELSAEKKITESDLLFVNRRKNEPTNY